MRNENNFRDRVYGELLYGERHGIFRHPVKKTRSFFHKWLFGPCRANATTEQPCIMCSDFGEVYCFGMRRFTVVQFLVRVFNKYLKRK